MRFAIRSCPKTFLSTMSFACPKTYCIAKKNHVHVPGDEYSTVGCLDIIILKIFVDVINL